MLSNCLRSTLRNNSRSLSPNPPSKFRKYRIGAPLIGMAAVLASTLSSCSFPGAMGPAAYTPSYSIAQTEEASEHNTESYDRIVDNPFVATADEPLSTFSIDVDTASYSNVRRFLEAGQLPPPDAVRIEELINYFSYDYAEPNGDTPFSVTSEVNACPWAPDHRLVHIGLKGKGIEEGEMPPRNLVFLLDVSGSMNGHNRLPLLKAGLGLLIGELGPEDTVSIVVYAGAAGLVLPPTPGDEKDTIRKALNCLTAGGSTAGGAGIQLAYETAEQNFVEGAINRVILATDGDFNVGMSSRGGLERLIEEKRESGIFLTVLGFGTGNTKDSQMEMLADKGNGNYAYIDSIYEAKKVLVTEAGSTLVTIAKDVKIQVEFNPQHVEGYRLIGYENRVLANRDFLDDAKDAGEIGAGHTVTALFEIIPAGAGELTSSVAELKYQEVVAPKAGGYAAHEMLTFKVRYKDPTGEASRELVFPVVDDASHAPSSDFNFSAAVAAFGMELRDSAYKGTTNMSMVKDLAMGAKGQDPFGYREAFIKLVDLASSLKP